MSTAPISQRALNRIRRTWRRNAQAGIQGWRHALRGQRPELHAFVVAVQRSGANMTNVLDRSFETTVLFTELEQLNPPPVFRFVRWLPS